MKYVRNYTDFKKYTFEFFDSFLPPDLSEKMVNSFLLGLGDKESLERQTLSYIKFQPLDYLEVADYGEAILQLNDYKDLLKKFVELLLKSNSYEALCTFISRIFVPEIGDVKYHSHKKDYTIFERYFDRFVEISIYCNIDRSLCTPFYLALLNSDTNSRMFVYKEPLKEYLEVYLKDGDEDDEFISALLSNANNVSIGALSSAGNVKTIKMLLTEYANGEFTNSMIIKKILLKNKQDGFNVIEELLSSEDENVRFKAVQMLVLIKEDRRVFDRLKFLYQNSSDSKTRTYLEKECGFTSLVPFDSKEAFMRYVDNNVKTIQERLFGARLRRYYDEQGLKNEGIEGKILTFVMDFFKNKDIDNQLGFAKDYFRYVDEEVLSKLANVVCQVAIHRNRLQGSKWSLRLIAVFGDRKLIIDMIEILKDWSVNNVKDVYTKYFVSLLAEAKRQEIIEVVRELEKLELNKKQRKFLDEILTQFSVSTNQNIEQLNDKLVDDYGFDKDGKMEIKLASKTLILQIESDCSISIFNKKTGKRARIREADEINGESLRFFIKRMIKEIKTQKKRLFASFLEFRQYSCDTFKECILDNNLLNFLSKNLFWGRYKGDKLVEVCVLKDDTLTHAVGNLIIENFEEYQIALVQTMDIEEYENSLKGRITPLFDQFDFPVFRPIDLKLNASYVANLSGTFCNAKLFVTRLQKLKYKINDMDETLSFGTLVKTNKNLDLLTSVEFDKVNSKNLDCSTTLSRVTFYRLSKLTKSQKHYNIDQKEALVLSDINSRVLSNELALISLACRN